MILYARPRAASSHARPPAGAQPGGPGHHRHLLRGGAGHRLLPQAPHAHRRGFLPGRPRDDRLGGRPQLPGRQPGLAGADGLGGGRVPIRHPGHPLVLGGRHPRDALPGGGDDALLLHLEDPLGSRLFEAALRRAGPRALGGLLRLHDRADERHQHVLDGPGAEGGARLGHPLLDLGRLDHGGRLRDPGRPALGHLQRGAAIRADLAGRAADPHSRPDRDGRLERHDRAHLAKLPRPGLHPPLAHHGLVRRQPDGHSLDRHRLRPRLGDLVRLLDHRLPGGAARARRPRPALSQAGPHHRLGLQDDGAVHRDPAGPARPGAAARQAGRRERSHRHRRAQL